MNEPRRTAREWLLARHAPADASLDAIRRRVMAGHLPTEMKRHAQEVHSITDLLFTVFGPQRRAWVALAALWLLLAALHLTIARPPTVRPQGSLNPEIVAFHLAHLDPHDSLARIGGLD